MIKTINTNTWTTWTDLESKISQLPEDKRRDYDALKERFDAEIKSLTPNHELIASLITQASELFVLPLST